MFSRARRLAFASAARVLPLRLGPGDAVFHRPAAAAQLQREAPLFESGGFIPWKPWQP